MKHPYLLLAIAALGAGIAVSQYTRSADAPPTVAGLPPLTDLSGNTASLDQWRGQVVLLNFWATWCAPCREEIPLLISTAGKYRSEGLVVVGVAVDEVEPVRQYAQEIGMDYPTLLLSAAKAPAWMEHYGNTIGALPFSVIFKRSGEVDSTKLGAYSPDELEGLVRQAFAD